MVTINLISWSAESKQFREWCVQVYQSLPRNTGPDGWGRPTLRELTTDAQILPFG